MLAFLRTNARWIAGGFLLTFFSSFGQTFFIGLSGGELRAKFDLSDGEFGLLYMTATLASAATLPALGRTLDSMPGWKVARFVIPALAGACLLIAFAPILWLVLAALYLLRLFGQGMMAHIALTETGRWFSASRGRAMSLVVPGHQAGEALFPVTFAIIAAAFGWQMAWIGGAAFLMLVALPLIIWLFSVERVPTSAEDSATPERTARDWTRAEVLRDPYFYMLLFCVLAPPFIGTTIFFHQDYFVDLRGYDPLAFAAAFPVMAATTVTFALISGSLIDRYGALGILPYFLLPLAIASLAAGLVTPVWGVYVFMVLLGVSYGFTSTLAGALWPELYGIKHLGAVRSVIVAAMVFSTALGPGITGALIDMGIGLPVQMLWMAGWCIVASLLLALMTPALRRRT
ncbi:MFS transporter [Parasphingopyxis sp. CP4]|uniref:MFS transporter n=1 Tax=Parasphingopyxis sp. CP4 TaxID=2724527 RepID=UPI0015A36832|nr:MFS transporter [Parasphingopyxis sp. CP4]QLC21294.1 MFS transporter [Parasphingopyxis sp. CP4]